MRDLQGKVAVVTGAGSGIGRATALRLTRAGMTVAVCDRDTAAAGETAVLLSQAGGASVHTVDVASESEMRSLVEDVLDRHGHVDVVVNNAGIGIAPTRSPALDLDRFRQVMAVNFWGVVHGSLFFLPHLLERPEANLVNVASNAALLGYPCMAPYTSSKFAVRGFTETLRMELLPTKVRVALVCPGATRTRLLDNSPVIDEALRRVMQSRFDRTALRSPDAVAQAIERAIRRDRSRALVGPDTAVMDAVVRILPGRYTAVIGPAINRFMDKSIGPRPDDIPQNQEL